MPRWLRRWGLPLALLLAAFAARAWNLGGPSLWYDEAYMWWATTQVSFSKMLALSLREIIPPLYYLLMWVWVRLAGVSEFALRYPSALTGVLAVAAAGRLAGRLTHRRVGMFAALALCGGATPLLWAAREVRMYGPLLAWTLLAGAALVETLFACDARSRRCWAWGWAAATLASLYTLVLAAFWLIGQGLFVLAVLLRRDKTTAREWVLDLLLPGTLVGALFAAWVFAALGVLGDNAGYWVGYLPSAAFLRTAALGVTLLDFLPSPWAEGGAALILLSATLILALARRRPWAALYPLLNLLPLGVMALIFRNLPKWGARHAVLFAPLPFLALAVGWGSLPRRAGVRRTASIAALTLATALTASFTAQADYNLLANPAFAQANWRSVAAYVQAHRQPGDVVIVETGSVFPIWAYYAGYDGLLPLPNDELLDVNHILHYGNTTPELNIALPTAPNVWLVSWIEHVTDPTGIVAALLGTLGPETPVPVFHGVGVRHFALERAPNFPATPPTTARPGAELLPDLQLWGYTLPDSVSGGQTLELWTYWTTAAPEAHVGRFYQVLLQLHDASGSEWARLDATPGSGDYRPERWPVATPVLGRLALPLDPWLPSGSYTPTLTLYEPGGASGSVFTLTAVQVFPPAAPPALPESAATVSPGGSDAPLALLGIESNQQTLTPCAMLEGALYWEVADPTPMLYTVTLALETMRASQEIALPPGLRAGDRFAAKFQLPIDCRALDVQTPLVVTLSASKDGALAQWAGPEVRIQAGRNFILPPGLFPLAGDFGPGFAALRGYTLTPELRAGQPFTLTLYWGAGVTDARPRTVFVHVTPPDAPAPLVAQHDSWPALGGKPTNTWAVGEIIADPHPLPGLPAGAYRMRIGLYDEGGVRLPVALPDETENRDSRDILIEIQP